MPGFVTEADMLPFVPELLEVGFGPEAEVLEALKRRHGNKQMAIVDLLDRNAVDPPRRLADTASVQRLADSLAEAQAEGAPADRLTSPEERRTARLILDGYPRDLVERALEITEGNMCRARDWLARNHAFAGRGATDSTAAPEGGVEQPGSAEVSDAESEEVGPLTLEPIPRGEAVTVLGDPTAQKYTRSVLIAYLSSTVDPVLPTTGQKLRSLTETRRKSGESEAAWIERILIPVYTGMAIPVYQWQYH